MKRKYNVEDVSLRESNTSKKYYTGSRHQMRSGEWLTVLGQCDIPYVNNTKTRYNHFLIKFDNNYKCVTSVGGLNKFNILNPFTPSVYGVGYEGALGASIPKKVRGVWSDIIRRCYGKNASSKFPTYVGCTLSPDWFNLSTFYKDIQTLPNYNLWLKNTDPYAWAFDKDIKVKGNKVYSKDTCMFVSFLDNQKEMNDRKRHKKMQKEHNG